MIGHAFLCSQNCVHLIKLLLNTSYSPSDDELGKVSTSANTVAPGRGTKRAARKNSIQDHPILLLGRLLEQKKSTQQEDEGEEEQEEEEMEEEAAEDQDLANVPLTSKAGLTVITVQDAMSLAMLTVR